MSQKEIFLESEADAWFARNHQAITDRDFSKGDTVVEAIADLINNNHLQGKLRILEIGCGEGARLAWLAKHFDVEVVGIEPSTKAVECASVRGIEAIRGTADTLPFESGRFDIVIFGFCLYLCDRRDLFRIAQEADRVLKKEGWLVINDFFSPTPVKREYHHRPGINSYKMDYRKLFDWHPDYTCFSNRVAAHGGSEFTDDSQEWVSISIMRKRVSE